MSNRITVSACLLLAAAAQAHLTAGSFTPMTGTFKVGDVVSITWKEDEVHSKIDFALSKDGGKTFANFKTGLADVGKTGNLFKWTIQPGDVTTQGKLRICQNGPCTDAMNVDKTGGNSSPWYMVSGNLTIAASTAINPATEATGLSLDFDAASRNLDVTFDLAAPGEVALRAFDLEGRQVAELLRGPYAAGAHHLSVYANRLAGAQGLVFKLEAAAATRTFLWMPVR